MAMQSESADKLLVVSKKLSTFVENVGKFGSLFLMPLVFVTMWDVIMRKLGGFQIWAIENFGSMFESTKIQEFEWHFHTALFCLVLGYGFVNNRHVRVDLLREKLSFRAQVWIDFFGTLLFLLPYTVIVGMFAAEYTWEAFTSNEISASTVGLTHRWIIKSVLVIGLFVTALAGISVWLQTVVVLFGPQGKRFELMTLEWPEEQNRKNRLRLKLDDDAVDTLKPPPAPPK